MIRFLGRVCAVMIGLVGSFVTCGGVAFEESNTVAFVGGGLVFFAALVWVLAGTLAGKRKGRPVRSGAGAAGYVRTGASRRPNKRSVVKTWTAGGKIECDTIVFHAPPDDQESEVADASFRSQIREFGCVLAAGQKVTEDEVDALLDYLQGLEIQCPHCRRKTHGPGYGSCFLCDGSLKGVRIPITIVGGRFCD